MMQNNVFECINITNVINKLGLKKTNQIGNNIFMCCPFCQKKKKKNGYMKVSIQNNCYICDNCESSGTSIELYAKLKYMTNKEAFTQLLREIPVLDNIPYTYNNPIKDELYRDIVYSSFLDMQNLNDKHMEKLQKIGLSKEYINKHNFKSIETREKQKKEICLRLQEQGLKLDGIPGFMQDKDFKWTYKSHKGIFIPVYLDNKIQGLRILLDKEYRNDTKNIWFSSNNAYNGTKANNFITILKNEEFSWADMYNSKNKTSIIIATEMILAHKLFHNTNKIVIGIPNNVDKDIIINLINRMKVKEVFVYHDIYSIKHTSVRIYRNVIESLENIGIKVHFRIITNYFEEEAINEEIHTKVA